MGARNLLMLQLLHPTSAKPNLGTAAFYHSVKFLSAKQMLKRRTGSKVIFSLPESHACKLGGGAYPCM